MTELDDWQGRLAQHFGQLRDARAAAGGDHPVFALEHGLEGQELEALVAALRDEILRGPPSPEHALAWVVYATEIGYLYSGDEYWQTFEERTPEWTRNGERIWMRDRYLAFRRDYSGAEPTGAWAERFSIICWPITHAVLPRDLQRQLAQHLYELRGSLTAEILESPAALGELIRARSWSATARFRNLAQEPILVGQIAAALLLGGETCQSELIHEAALRRIGEDLDRERRTRAWLQSARRVVRDQVRVRGVARRTPSARSPKKQAATARHEAAVLGIEPRLILRPADPSRTSWDVSLEVPDLTCLLTKLPGSQETLTSTRCRVAGARGRPMARGRCLHGRQQVLLARWPRAGELLLKFDRADPELEFLLAAECTLRPRPTWLFRIASDGVAYECRGSRVRPGGRYVLATTGGPLEGTEDGIVQPVTFLCEGVHGALLELPAAFPTRIEGVLEALGLGCTKSVEIWPAGLSAAVWDGVGRAEWGATERPCLAILSDHPLSGLWVSVGEGEAHRLELGPLTPGVAVFVELPQLSVGSHTVYLSPVGSWAPEGDQLGQLDVMIRAQEARSWSPGLAANGPLIADVAPVAPTLEDLWEGRVELSLQGPEGRAARCQVSMLERDDAVVIRAEDLPEVRLPMTSDEWRRYFKSHIQGNDEAQVAYDVARACEICFHADELGAYTLRCEREFRPLRWSVRRAGQRYSVRLVDDSGGTDTPTTARIAFESPTVYEPLGPALEHEVPEPGGLYVAEIPGVTAAVVVPPLVRNLEGFRCRPEMGSQDRDEDALSRFVALARLWAEARLTGNVLAASRQHQVLRALTSHLFRVIGGNSWAMAERSFESDPGWLDGLKRTVSRLPEEVGLGAALKLDIEELGSVSCERRSERLARLGRTFLGLPPSVQPGVDVESVPDRREVDADYLSELALRLASDPARAGVWAGQRLRPGLAYLLETPTLARAARFLVLAVDSRRAQGGDTGRNLYAGWDWE